jgi:uncharacterized membrane protein
MRVNIKRLTQLAMLTAVTVILGFVVKVPTGFGFVTLMDAGVFLSALLFQNRKYSAVVGGLSGFLIDLMSGYPQWMVFSLIIHGLQGYTAVGKQKTTSFAIAGTIMVIGYAIASCILYGWSAGLADIPTNIVQNLIGMAVAIMVSKLLEKTLWISN